jgi:TonB family protein
MAVVQFVVDEKGRVGEPRVVRASHEQFGPAAVRALEQARFTPATLEGRPIRKRVTQPVSFTLPRTGEGELPPISSEAVNRSLVGYGVRAGGVVEARVNGPEAEEMRVRHEEMRVRGEEMRVRHDRTQAAVRAALRQRHPEIARDGLPADRYLWLVADSEGRVASSGILPINFGPLGSWSSTSVERQLRDRFPTVEADYTIIMGLSLDSARKLNVAWVTPRSKAAR